MALSRPSRAGAVVLALGLACCKGFVAIVDFARELSVAGVEARAAAPEAEVVVASEADASQTAARTEQYDAFGQSGQMPAGQPDNARDQRFDKQMSPLVAAEFGREESALRDEFKLRPELMAADGIVDALYHEDMPLMTR